MTEPYFRGGQSDDAPRHEPPETRVEECGVQGYEDVGYCRCTLPKDHRDQYGLPSEHACRHGAW